MVETSASTRRELFEVIAFWLLLAAEEDAFFRSAIEQLAAEQRAPVFEPHVTLYASDIGEERALAALKDSDVPPPLELNVGSLYHSEKFTKTIFVRLYSSSSLQRLGEELQARAGGGAYELNPHVSLIYKDMPADERAEVAQRITVPFKRIRFDRLKLIHGSNSTKTAADVEGWRAIGERALTR
ncbi:MAG: hypothetical protein H0T11_08810 [Chthoniobacterales bacterium]|nr:hypothetical protein [Chthoniobacterales bacterium]